MRLLIAALVAAFSCLLAAAALGGYYCGWHDCSIPCEGCTVADDKAPLRRALEELSTPPLRSLRELFAPLHHGACVRIDAVRQAGATFDLTPEQFQFVRAFWMATRPASRELPPGDHAFLVKGKGGMAVLGLYDEDGEVCAIFEAEDWMLKLVDAVARGEVGHRGDPL